MDEPVKPKKILVVDDEKETLDFLSNTLKRVGFEVLSTTRGEEAVKLAKERKPDLIVLDILIPDMSGGKVADILYEDPATYKIPVIFVTGIIHKRNEGIVKKSGTHYIIAKPVSPQELIDSVNAIISK